ncbi:MAG: DEAD/DEAH box helicase [Sphaerochaetaceae bacterium]|nr:DEAD/DEAH box helicase [Sphaerochaetaceae bacterium]MDD4258330.1 DEAD/DEAH box helicase [Sphaerochaetaceae bacterium]MDD4762683.1 DEAD/DEAH box helicase [Sphaerochaetaceae bacterium]MDD4841079.1 DEAD/DEAH box helicase [Sphaerochaetaceae bacterium]MDD5075472.1 DEAD/DEAH box helicase [Sphaerochaetaceae bacterium]
MKFSELPLHHQVMKGIEASGFADCMPVQEKVLPIVLAGKDVMVQSKTGSGKTAVFLLAILQKFAEASENVLRLPAEKAFTVQLPVAMIVSPTRELAVQIESDARLLASGFKDFRIGCFYGGVGYGKQDKQIEEGLDLIIGTPGRLLDYQQMHKIDFRKIDTFVLDEADRMFDMGFYPDVQKMFSMMVKRDQRQTMLFSATLGTRVRQLAWEYMNEPVEVEVQPEEITVKAITQELYHVSKEEKFLLFLQLLNKENPPHALIFTNTKAKAVELSKRLVVNGFQTQYLMGDLPQSKRLQVINRMKRGELRFLVATDVAARGLQIDDLELVVNYDIPEDFESYVHRIGRTARAGKSGKAITLACEQFVFGLEAIENYIQMKIPVIWPEPGSLPDVEDKSASMRFRDLVDESEFSTRPTGRTQSKSGRSNRPMPKRTIGAYKGAKKPQTNRNEDNRKQHGKTKINRLPAQQRTVDYAKIQKMDFDERLAYYKKTYTSQETEKKEVKPSPEKQRKFNPVEQPSRNKKNDAHVIQSNPTVEQPKKKQIGLLARLFVKRKKNV